MKRRTYLSGSFFALVLFLSPHSPAEQSGAGRLPLTKENLDLPGAAFGITEPDDDSIEAMTFFGQQYEGDGFFFVLDRSGSTREGELAIGQREAARSISELSDRVQFGVVYYDTGTLKFPASGQPAEANPGMKSAAIGFIHSIVPGGSTCVQRGLMEGLAFANASSARRNQIILLTDGHTTCPGAGDATAYGQQTLNVVTSANFQRIPMHAICVGSDVSEWFPRQLAAMNNGTYARVRIPR